MRGGLGREDRRRTSSQTTKTEARLDHEACIQFRCWSRNAAGLRFGGGEPGNSGDWRLGEGGPRGQPSQQGLRGDSLRRPRPSAEVAGARRLGVRGAVPGWWREPAVRDAADEPAGRGYRRLRQHGRVVEQGDQGSEALWYGQRRGVVGGQEDLLHTEGPQADG